MNKLQAETMGEKMLTEAKGIIDDDKWIVVVWESCCGWGVYLSRSSLKIVCTERDNSYYYSCTLASRKNGEGCEIWQREGVSPTVREAFFAQKKAAQDSVENLVNIYTEVFGE